MTQAVHIAITSRGVEGTIIERVRGDFARRLAGMTGRVDVTIFDGPLETDLAAALAQPALICIDAQCLDRADPVPPRSAILSLMVSTATATRLDVAAEIRYAVQEAIGNAVIHGNLGLDGAMRASMEELRLFAAAMEQRLADPVHACLPITVAATHHEDGVAISVEDRGAGFHPSSVRAPVSAAAGGLGLTIIKKCCREIVFSLDGRRITMIFGAA
ncbi:MAG: ATP-binding protein [Phaeospirillum sp.]|nr:ATP-binding protein [Phaeospirillum sp.]